MRALIPAKNLPEIMTEPSVRLWFGGEGHAVHYPVAGGERINLVMVFPDEYEGEDGEEKTIKQLPTTCETWCRPLQELIAAAPSFRRWPLYDRPPLAAVGQGPCDAAWRRRASDAAVHGAGRGGSGRGLRFHLENFSTARKTPRPSLRAYERERAPRAARLQAASIENGHRYHMSGVKRFARDLLLPRMGGERLIARNDWVYRYRV